MLVLLLVPGGCCWWYCLLVVVFLVLEVCDAAVFLALVGVKGPKWWSVVGYC